MGALRMIKIETWANSAIGFCTAFVVNYLPIIQSITVFTLTVIYFGYKIKKAKEEAKFAENRNKIKKKKKST